MVYASNLCQIMAIIQTNSVLSHVTMRKTNVHSEKLFFLIYFESVEWNMTTKKNFSRK